MAHHVRRQVSDRQVPASLVVVVVSMQVALAASVALLTAIATGAYVVAVAAAWWTYGRRRNDDSSEMLALRRRRLASAGTLVLVVAMVLSWTAEHLPVGSLPRRVAAPIVEPIQALQKWNMFSNIPSDSHRVYAIIHPGVSTAELVWVPPREGQTWQPYAQYPWVEWITELPTSMSLRDASACFVARTYHEQTGSWPEQVEVHLVTTDVSGPRTAPIDTVVSRTGDMAMCEARR